MVLLYVEHNLVIASEVSRRPCAKQSSWISTWSFCEEEGLESLQNV